MPLSFGITPIYSRSGASQIMHFYAVASNIPICCPQMDWTSSDQHTYSCSCLPSSKYSSNRLALVLITLINSRIWYLTFQRFARIFHWHLIKASLHTKVLKMLYFVSHFLLQSFQAFFSSLLCCSFTIWNDLSLDLFLSSTAQLRICIIYLTDINSHTIPVSIELLLKICRIWPFSFERREFKSPLHLKVP